MKKEAEAAAASAEVAAARVEEQQKTDRTLMLVAQSKRRKQDVSCVAIRAKTMVNVLFRLKTELCAGTRWNTWLGRNHVHTILMDA